MKKKDKEAKLDKILAKGEDIEFVTADGVKVQGTDGGEYLILKHIIFQPNYLRLKQDGFDTEEKIAVVAKESLERSLFDYCKAIGWWPVDNLNPYRITKEKDGYTLSAHLQEDKNNLYARSVSEISDQIGINEK